MNNEPEDDGGAWAHEASLEEAWLRHELARAAELAAKYGHCPERAPDVERGLLEVAGLNKFELAA